MRGFVSLLFVSFALVTSVASATLPTDAAEPVTPPEPAPHDPMPESLGHGRIIGGSSAHRVLHFTFDDGPSRSHTRQVLDTLEAHGAHATFFLVARRLEHERDRELARQIAARGHTIGLHSYGHDRVDAMDAAQLNADFDRSEALFAETFGARPFLFRPPYGHHSDVSDVVASERGYTQVLWNLHGGDVTGRSADDVVATFRSMLDRGDPRGEGGVVLLHDTHPWTAEALPRLFDEIDARNCDALAAGDELWDVAPDLSPWHQSLDGASATRSARRMRMEAEAHAARQAELRAAAEVRCGGEA